MKITAKHFGTLLDGTPVTLYTMAAENGAVVQVLDYGVTIRGITVPDRSGNPVDVALGYDTLEEYTRNDGYLGAVVGRFANRIAGGRFTLNGKEYRLACNDGDNHLHGGDRGYDKYVWDCDETETGLRFTRLSPDGEEGYPGDLHLTVEVCWDGTALEFRYAAKADADTVLNLTNHTYFNLSGTGDVLRHRIQICADGFTINDAGCLPTGRIVPVDGTAMDLRQPRAIGEAIDADEDCVKLSGGYDCNFILSGSPAARVWSPDTGIAMTVETDQPGIQFYSGNFLSARSGKDGAVYDRRYGFCLETQHYPDSVNRPQWPTPVLRAGETFRSRTRYVFGVE